MLRASGAESWERNTEASEFDEITTRATFKGLLVQENLEV